MEERRRIERIEYNAKSVLVLCESQKKYVVETENISPLGMAITISENIDNIVGQDAIIVTPTMIMYVEISRKENLSDNNMLLGLQAINFTPDVLEYISKALG